MKLFCGILTVCIFLVFAGCEQRNIIDKESDVASPTSMDKTIYLEISERVYSLQDDVIHYSIINNTGEEKWVVLAPLLERETLDGWEKVSPANVGFCGTPDKIDTIRDGELLLSWYADSLVTGRYRLSFNVVNDNNYDTIEILSDVFELTDPNVTLSVKENRFDAKGATLVVMNSSEYDYTYGELYIIERKSNDGWKPVDTIIQDYGFILIGYSLRAGQTIEIEVNWEWLYGKLAPGEYRITKTVDYVRAPGDFDTYNLSAEFTID